MSETVGRITARELDRAAVDAASREAQAGFTLMEVITAIFIFFCGIMGVLSLFTTAVALHKTAKDRTVTALVLEQVVGEIRSQVEDGLLLQDEDGRFEPVEGQPLAGHPGYTYSASFEETGDEEGEGAVLARISIGWKSRGRDVKENFVSVFRSREGMRHAILQLRADPAYRNPKRR